MKQPPETFPISSLQPGHVVSIGWIDSRVPTSEWSYFSSHKHIQPPTCLTFGMVVSIDSVSVNLAMSVADIGEEGTQVMGIITIPVNSIRSVVRYEAFDLKNK